MHEDIFESLKYNPKLFMKSAKAYLADNAEGMCPVKTAEYIIPRTEKFAEATENFVKDFARSGKWEEGLEVINRHIKDFPAICKMGQYQPKNFGAIINEFSDYFTGLCEFISLVIDANKDTGVNPSSVRSKIELVKEKNKPAVKGIVEDPKFSFPCQLQMCQESYSDLVDILDPLKMYTEKIIAMCNKTLNKAQTEEMLDGSGAAEMILLLYMTTVKFVGKTIKHIICVPEDVCEAAECANEEYAVKRVF